MPELPSALHGAPALRREAAATHEEISALAARYVAAQRGAIRLVNLAGSSVEDLATRLPVGTRKRLDEAAAVALRIAYGTAAGSHIRRPGGARAHRAAAAALGALGGIGGIPTALAELPVTTTTILRSIQEIARSHGEDLQSDSTRLACLQVLGAGGPLAEDDGADLAFLGARLTLTGAALQGMITSIAPRFAATLAQRFAAKAVPVLGAAAGAGLNLAFARYYQEMAEIHFGLRRLTRNGALHAPAAFRAEVQRLRIVPRG